MKKRHIYIIAFAFFAASCGNKVFKQAEGHYQKYEYAVAAAKYEEYLTKHDNNNVAKLHLADCYKNMNQHEKAEVWYQKAIDSPDATAKDKLSYAYVLKESGKYQEAKKWFEEYLKSDPNNPAVKNQMISCDSMTVFNKPNPFYTITPVQFKNLQGSIFSPNITGDTLLVTAEAPVKNDAGALTWTGHGFLNVYSARFSDTCTCVLYPLAGDVNSKYHDGPAVLSPNNMQLYFTRSILLKRNKPSKAQDSDNHLELCVAEKNAEGKWTNIKKLPFNNPEYSCGHPSITADGKRLYFISDMPGGMGGTDIYYSDYVNGEWQKPVNAGSMVNTNGNEMFPTIRQKSANVQELYFSTDGLPGAGGLDLYKCDMEGNNIKKYERLPYPFNTSGDDFGIVFHIDGKSGYFTSNRGTEDGHDVIYQFQRIDPRFFVEVKIKEKGASNLLPNTAVQVTSSKTGATTTLISDERGIIFFEADSVTNYSFVMQREGFFKGYASLNTGGFHMQFLDTSYATIEIEPIVINKPIRLENIYYDYDKWNIRPDAAIELNKLVKIMNDNPQIKIELSSHTDCRGSDAYNEKLSQRRAESAVNYIISQGISKDRITAKGYGEKKLLNKCDDGVQCTEEEHQWNRRTEFKVTHIIAPGKPAK